MKNKTFEDLKFNDIGISGKTSRITFDNGWGASVIIGPHTYGGDEGLYELAVLHNDEIHYDNPVANGDVMGYLTPEEVTEAMIAIQKFETL